MAQNLTAPLQSATHKTGEAIQEHTFSLGGSTVTRATVSSNTALDPLAGKTNKYAESSIVAVTPVDTDMHIKFGDASVTDATVSDHWIKINETHYFLVNPNQPYIRMIGENLGTGFVIITEIK